MLDHLSDLQLDTETVQIDRQFSEGLAVAYRNTAERTEGSEMRRTYLAYSATNFRRAGAHSILLDDLQAARTSFANAAQVYWTLAMPYGLMISALSGRESKEATQVFERFLRRFRSAEEFVPQVLRRQWIYAVLFHSSLEPMGQREWGNVEGTMQDIRRELESSRSSPMGILGLPVNAYLNLATALAGNGELPPEEALLPFFSAYDTAVSLASRNEYHWRKMVIPFHPAEPDILSLLVLAHSALQRQKKSIFDLLKLLPLSWRSRTILSEALQGQIGHA